MEKISCPKCKSLNFSKSGTVKGRQRFKCKNCSYHFSVAKVGKQTDNRRKVAALQLYLEGFALRAIAEVLNVSNVSVLKWTKQVQLERIPNHQSKKTLLSMTRASLLLHLVENEKKEMISTIVQIEEDCFVVAF